MANIAEVLSKGIKEGKWIDITYKNSQEEITYYWIAIVDINFKEKKLICDIFNSKKSNDTMNVTIRFDGILRADTLSFTSYEVPQSLIDKLENSSNADSYWLSYNRYNCNILKYYEECNRLDSDPYQKEFAMIKGIDKTELRKNKRYQLSEEQSKEIINKIYHKDLEHMEYQELIISIFSISIKEKKYIVCYYPLTYNPKNKTLVCSNKLCFNKSFLIEGRKHSLINYIDCDVEEFISNFTINYKASYEMVQENLRYGEEIDTRPDIMILQRDNNASLVDTYRVIEEQYDNNELSLPLKAFFGKLIRTKNRKEPSIAIYDKRINIDQMRVLYNSLKQPVTYVQGPPGTGKTQTLLNVLLCNFINDRSMLICSSNNKPVDGIIEKISFLYKGREVPFPYLRLGNFEEVINCTKRIYDLYNYETYKQPKLELINRIKENNDQNNALLRRKLEDYELRLELTDLIENGSKLISSFNGNHKGGIINKIESKIQENKKKLDSIPYVSDESVLNIFTPAENNPKLSEYLYFMSIYYINKLKEPKYSELIKICSQNDDETRASDFNKWTQKDENMKLLINAFPVILSTNISCSRLGTPNTKFDLVVMDEAGQCNVAHALLPISRANNLLLVGDTNQLRPVILLEDSVNQGLINKYNIEESYSYKGNSILSLMQSHDTVSKRILLSHHYRCGKKIINFSNKRYYQSLLKIENIQRDGDLVFLESKNQNIGKKNANIDECLQIINYIKRNNVTDAMIITPFVNQQNLMNELLDKANMKDISCGTIHSLQGAEKDTIILSTSISPRTSKNTYNWIKNNSELLNVAVTRAKNKLIISSDYETLNALSDKSDDLYSLIEYVRSNGTNEVQQSETTKIEIGKSNGSKAEDEFFKTISQFCSTNKSFEAKRNVSYSQVFPDNASLRESKSEFDVVLYKKNLFGAKSIDIIIEINGGEHFGDYQRERNDKLKRELCKKNGWKFISIPNSFVKSYEEIREIILSTKGKEYEQQSLFDI